MLIQDRKHVVRFSKVAESRGLSASLWFLGQFSVTGPDGLFLHRSESHVCKSNTHYI